MSRPWIVVLVLLWIGSLVGVATVAAQVGTQQVPPKILSGPDIGFRVESIEPRSGSVLGRIVVNVNGKWVDAYVGGGAAKLTP